MDVKEKWLDTELNRRGSELFGCSHRECQSKHAYVGFLKAKHAIQGIQANRTS